MKSKKQRAKRRPVLPYRRIFPRVTAAAFACSLCMWMPNPVWAGDIEGANVIQGSATIAAGIDPSITNITASDRAIIEYQQFNISSQNTVNFIQPSATSAVLNRIIGNSPSTLNGTLNANGQVYFVNPAGVYFGPNSVINAARFHAAAGNITNEDFNAGIMRFTATGALINDGTITADDGVTLVGQSVTNNGSIVAANGLVSLSSGDTEYIADGDSRVLVKVDSLTANGQTRAAESDVDGTGVANNGSIEADEVIFSSGDVYSLAIKNTGTVTAAEDVTIASGGDVENTGTIEAGNDVKISGDFATLASGSINAGNVASLKVNHFQLGGDLSAGQEIYLDPTSLTVVDSNAGVDEVTNDDIVANLNAGTDVTLAADDTITVDAPITTTQNQTATLALNDENGGADLTVNLNAAITLKSNQTLTGEATVTNVSNDATINNAMDVLQEGGTINVAAGTYDEDLSIDKSLTLNGANAGISAVDGVRGAESIIDGDIMITADDTTIDGFEQVNFKYNGMTIRAENNVTIANNIIHDPNTGIKAAGAILIQPVVNPDKTTATVDNIVITDNLIDIPGTHTSTAGMRFTLHNYPNTSEYFIDYNNVTIANNEFITPYRSIWSATSTANFHINNLDITGNNFHDSGTALNLGNMDAASSIIGNNFQDLSTAIVVHFREAGAQISGNTFNNVAGSGIYFFDDTWFPTTSEGATVTGNNFTNVGRHIYSASANVDVNGMAGSNTFDKTVFASSSDNIFGTIQYAVDEAQVGDTITVSDGTFVENVTIDKGLTLVSENGYTATTIEGVATTGEAGTVYINSSNVQLGEIDHGFTIIGIDGNGAIEQAAVYINGSQDSLAIIGNEIVANGDAGLMTEWGLAVTNVTIDNNIFSGQTFAGPNPGGEGFSTQFDVDSNVPRQLVVFNGGSGSTNDNITFSNNLINGTAGGLNIEGAEQGNTLVTIDAVNSLVSNNTFAGTTARYGAALRVRGAGEATIIDNTFDSTNMGINTAHIYSQMGTINGVDSYAGLNITNTFDRGAYFVGSANGASITTSLSNTVNAASDNAVIEVMSGFYDEGVITISADNVTLNGAQAGVDARTRDNVDLSGETVIDGSIMINAGIEGTTIDGVFIQNIDSVLGEYAAVYLNNNASNTTVQNTYIVGQGQSVNRKGIVTSSAGSTNNLFTQNVYEALETAVYLNPGAVGNTLSDSWIVDGRYGYRLISTTNTSITGNQFLRTGGVQIRSGWSAGAPANEGLVIENNDFSQLAGTGLEWVGYIDTYNGGGVVAGGLDISNNTFEGIAPSAMTSEQLFAVESLVHHAVDGASGTPYSDAVIYILPDQLFVSDSSTSSINNAIVAATAGDVINISSGTFTENVVIDKNVDVIGAGSSATFIDAEGGHGVLVSASGDSAQDRLTISGLTINDADNGIRLTSDQSHLAFDDVVVNTDGTYGINFNNGSYADVLINNSSFTTNTAGTGLKVGTSASIDGLTVTDSHFDGNNFGWYVGIPGSGGTTFTNISVSNTTFNNSSNEGLYIEKLDNAVFDNITISDTANTGMKLNLKYEAYDNIQIINSTFTDNGLVGNQGALTFMVRDDGSYASNPASLTNSVISGNTFDGNYVNANFQVPSGIAVTGNSFTNAASGTNLSNWTANPLNASGNYFGSTDIATVAGTIAGVVDFSPFLINGADQNAVAAGFQADGTRLMVHTQGSQTTGLIAEATGTAGVTEILIGGGTYSEEVDSPIRLTFIDAVNLSEDVSANGVVAFDDTVSFGVNDVAITATDVNFNGGDNSVTGSGNLTLAPIDPTSSIGVSEDAGNNVGGDFWIDAADYTAIADGFASRTFGDAVNGSGVITVGEVLITDPSTFATPQETAGDDILVYGPVTLDYDGSMNFVGDGDTTRILGQISAGANFAGAGNDVFSANDHVIFENTNINTGGGNIVINGGSTNNNSQVNTGGGDFTNNGGAQVNGGSVNTGGGNFNNTGNFNTTGTGTVDTTPPGGGAGGQLIIGGNVTGDRVVFESGSTQPVVNGPQGINVVQLQSSTLPATEVPIISNTENPDLAGETNPQFGGQVNGNNNPGRQGGDTQLALSDSETMPFSMQMALNENAEGSGANADPELAQQLDELFDNFLETQLAAFQLALNDAYSDYMANASADASMDVRMAGFYNMTQQNDKLTTQFKELLVMIQSVEKLAKSLGLDEAQARAMLFEKVKPANMSVAEFDALIKAYRSQQ